jgi:hypothetical protein
MHRRITGAAAIALAVGSGLAFTALPASAHEDCWDVTFSDSRLSDPGTPRTPSVPWGMQGGVGIRVGQAVSKDSASGRASGPAQPSERWEVEFLDAAGNVVGRSGVTDDLPDDTDDAMWSGEIAGAFVQNDVVAVRAHHRPDLGAAGTDNGVDAVSVQLCVESSATTTTATSTTTSPSTTTAPNPTTSTVPGTSTTTTAVPGTSTTTTAATGSTTSTTSTTVAKTTTTTKATVAGTTQSKSSGSKLATTGGSTAWTVLLGVMSLGAGAIALLLRRRLD